MKKLVVLMCVLSVVGVASAATVWNPIANTTNPGSTAWADADNWTQGNIPGSLDQVVFNVGGQVECQITGAEAASKFVTGENGTLSGGQMIRIMSGGSLSVGFEPLGNSWVAIGYNEDAGDMVVEAGAALDINAHLYLGMNTGAIGRLAVNGTVDVADTFRYGRSTGSEGYMDINDGGVFTARYLNSALPFGGLITISDSGKFVLTGGEDSDRDLTQALIDNGFMVAGAGQSLSLDLVENNWTVTAVPEPATMLLLGLGGLLIRRKK